MKKLKLTRERQERFVEALDQAGIVGGASEIAGTTRTRMYELWKRGHRLRSGIGRGRGAGRRHAGGRGSAALLQL